MSLADAVGMKETYDSMKLILHLIAYEPNGTTVVA